MTVESTPYPARLEIDDPKTLDRFSTLLRVLFIIPIAIVLGLLVSGSETVTVTVNETGERIRERGGRSILGSLFLVTVLMIVFRRRYPRWWFDFAREVLRFSTRVGAYLMLLTDRYPSTVEEQAVHLDIDYPDVERDLNRWLLPLKWLLAIPHYIILVALGFAAIAAVVIAWFAILLTGRYPRGLFDFVVGVGRWCLRVYAYSFLLVTDRYPPFSLR